MACSPATGKNGALGSDNTRFISMEKGVYAAPTPLSTGPFI